MASKPQKQELELAARIVDLGSSIIKSLVLDLVSLVAREHIPKDSFV